MKKSYLYGTSLLLLLCLLLNVHTVYALTPTEQFYVNDMVGVLGEAQQKDLVSRSVLLCEENGVQVVTVVVDNVIGGDIDAYANQVFNDFGIGQKNVDNGVLLLVAVQDREVRIQVGNGLEDIISDSKAGRILDEYFIPAAREDDFSKALYDTHIALVSAGSKATTPGVTGANAVKSGGGQKRANGYGGSPFGFGNMMMIIVIIAFIILFTSRRSFGRRRRNVFFPTIFMSPYRGHRGGRPRHHDDNSPFGGFSGGGGRSSGGGASRSFGGGNSFGGGRSSGGGSKSSGGGGKSSGGGAGRKF